MLGCTTGLKRIRAAVPWGWLVADKTGSGDYGTGNDTAIWPPSKAPIVLAVFLTQASKDAPVRHDVVAAAAKIAFDVLG